MFSQGGEEVVDVGSVGSVCGSGSGDVAEMEVGLDVGDDGESNESA